jgi:hypothetical protein
MQVGTPTQIVFGFQTVTFVPGLITFPVPPNTDSYAEPIGVPLAPPTSASPKFSPPIVFQGANG